MGLHLVSRILSPQHHPHAEKGGKFEDNIRKQSLERHIVNSEESVEIKYVQQGWAITGFGGVIYRGKIQHAGASICYHLNTLNQSFVKEKKNLTQLSSVGSFFSVDKTVCRSGSYKSWPWINHYNVNQLLVSPGTHPDPYYEQCWSTKKKRDCTWGLDLFLAIQQIQTWTARLHAVLLQKEQRNWKVTMSPQHPETEWREAAAQKLRVALFTCC